MKETLTRDDPTGWYRCRTVETQVAEFMGLCRKCAEKAVNTRNEFEREEKASIAKIVLPDGKETLVQAVERVAAKPASNVTTDDICRVLRSIADSGEGELFGHCPPEAHKLRASILKLRRLSHMGGIGSQIERAVNKIDRETSELVRQLCIGSGLGSSDRVTELQVREHLINAFEALKAVQKCNAILNRKVA